MKPAPTGGVLVGLEESGCNVVIGRLDCGSGAGKTVGERYVMETRSFVAEPPQDDMRLCKWGATTRVEPLRKSG